MSAKKTQKYPDATNYKQHTRAKTDPLKDLLELATNASNQIHNYVSKKIKHTQTLDETGPGTTNGIFNLLIMNYINM